VTSGVATMTEGVPVQDAACQSLYKDSAHAQTDDITATKAMSGVTDEELVEFLRRTAPTMIQALNENNSSSAFDEPEDLADDRQATVECVHVLNPFGVAEDGTVPSGAGAAGDPRLQELECTSISWNCMGGVVAAAFGRFDVEGWCTYPGALCTWNLQRSEVNPNKPDAVVELDSCLMCCAFHPKHPALVAGGTYNGELYIWDLSRDDVQRGKSQVSDATHREPISQVAWKYDSDLASKHSRTEEAYQIITVGADGRVLVWLWQKLDHPVYGYELVKEVPGTHKMVLWGGTSIAFSEGSADDRGTFVVGTEGGSVYKCFMHHNEHMANEFVEDIASGEGLKLRTPIKSTYEGHAGPVHGVDCSSFQRNLFMTCGADGTARVYNVLQAKPVVVLEPSEVYLFSVRWSPFRPLVCAVAAGDGRVFIYDLAASMLHPVKSIDVTGRRAPVHAISFNPKLKQYLAAGDGPRVKVYEMGPRLTEARAQEQRMADRLAEMEGANEEE